MLRQVFAPIHPDGWKFIGIAAVFMLILFVIWAPLGWIALILTLWLVYFFRGSRRGAPAPPRAVLCPAGGLVVSARAPSPPPAARGGGRPRPPGGNFL